MSCLLSVGRLLLSASLCILVPASVWAETDPPSQTPDTQPAQDTKPVKDSEQRMDEVVVEAPTEAPADLPLVQTVSPRDEDHPPSAPDASGIMKSFIGISTTRKGGQWR